MTSKAAQQNQNKSWRRRLLIIAVAIIGAHGVAFLIGRVDVSAQTEAPKYEIKHRKDAVGVAKTEEFYILTDPVDTSNDDFKQKVKSIIGHLANEKNLAEFSAYIYTDAEVLEYFYDTPLSDSVDENVAKAKAMSGRRETALVAAYYGGVNLDTAQADTSEDGYRITYFSGATTDNPTVGKYVGDEKWKPVLANSNEKKDSECFVATAAYGTHLTHDLDVFRDFRDNSLRTNIIGSKFVDGYYEYGPIAADFIRDKDILRGYIREFYLKPVATIIEVF